MPKGGASIPAPLPQPAHRADQGKSVSAELDEGTTGGAGGGRGRNNLSNFPLATTH